MIATVGTAQQAWNRPCREKMSPASFSDGNYVFGCALQNCEGFRNDGRKIGLLGSLFLAECVIHRPEGTVKGLAGIRAVVERNIAAYSQFATEVHDVFESGDRVVVRITHRATGSGMFRSRIGDHDVKGKQLTWDAIAIFGMQDGKIAEEWVNRDELGILLSAGVLNANSGAR